MAAARFFLMAGALNAALAVMLGAFGAHGLRGRLPADLLAIYQTGCQYHVYHALGLLLVGLLALHAPTNSALRWSGWLMLAGRAAVQRQPVPVGDHRPALAGGDHPARWQRLDCCLVAVGLGGAWCWQVDACV